MKKITLLAAFFAAFAMNAQETLWEDGFESYDDFTIDAIGDWTLTDLDGDPTYGSADYDFTNENYVGVSIVFNPANTTPAATGTAWDARTGDKGMYFIAESATPFLNDDYAITPQIAMNGTGGSEFTFYGKSLTTNFGEERFEVLLSTSGTDVGDFSVNLSDGEVLAPLDWTEYTYDLTPYEGQNIYIAIHYMGQDSFVFQTDDYSVTTATLGLEDQVFNGFSQLVDADNNLRLTANTSMDNVQLFNVLGQQVVSQKLSSNNESINISALNSGVYIATVTIEGQNKSFKIVKR